MSDYAQVFDDVIAVTPGFGLAMTVQIRVVRKPRSRCPLCLRRRVLFRLAAFTARNVVGDGEARCAPCAGLRP